jgi:hypothetical protein
MVRRSRRLNEGVGSRGLDRCMEQLVVIANKLGYNYKGEYGEQACDEILEIVEDIRRTKNILSRAIEDAQLY